MKIYTYKQEEQGNNFQDNGNKGQLDLHKDAQHHHNHA